jgi:hypothetical protein
MWAFHQFEVVKAVSFQNIRHHTKIVAAAFVTEKRILIRFDGVRLFIPLTSFARKLLHENFPPREPIGVDPSFNISLLLKETLSTSIDSVDE